MQRPSSSLSEHSVASSAGASSSLSRRPGTLRPGGPRKPTAKASMPSLAARAQQQQQEQQEQRLEQRQSLPPPSYVQSQHDLQRQAPLQSYTPPPPSAIASDSSCSHPPNGLVSRAGTPSSLAASSPVRTMSPAPILHAHPEESSAHQSPQHVSIPLPPSPRPTPEPEAPVSRLPTPSIPSISKPSTPAPESPISTTSAYVKPRTSSSVATPTPLQPPPSVDFSSVPIAWKPLTLEAAQWTFSSSELQTIVSRAIRASAEPSSIRLLPLQTLDEELVQESQRLESERAQATAQYRFTMHRRTMLLQSLNASSGSANSPSSFSPSNSINLSSAPAQSPAADLAQRLSEVSATLDRLSQTILRVSDQLSQIRSLQDVHAASALAVALRKLNASYARRTQEVQGLKDKLVAAEEERDEAWRFAEELAMEVDGDGEEYGDIEGDVVNGERAVAVSATLTRASRLGMRIRVPGVGPRVRPQDNEDDRPIEEEENADTADSPSSAPGETVESPAAIPRRRRANSATSRVTAARTRSLRASKASLRLPRSREPRPPSAYSQHSAQSGPSRVRSRANSAAGSPLDAPSPSSANAPSGEIPDVPKIPNAVELARLVSVKSTTSSSSSPSLSLPPMPPPPIETSPSKIGSFLDMMTRPNSASDDKGKSPEQSGGVKGEAGTKDNMQNSVALNDDEAQVNGAAMADDHSGGNEHHKEEDETGVKTDSEVDEAQVITIPPRGQMHHTPFSASHVETRGSALPEAAFAKMQLQNRPSLQVYPPAWTRPPPDSPMDVAHGSDPHRADNDDDIQDAEEAELADAFESAYAQTQAGGLAGYTRSPLRMQHAQSMLPFPGTEGRAPFLASAERTDGASPLLTTPQSDNTVAGPFRGAAASASSRRPTSMPSAQGEKPWNYF